MLRCWITSILFILGFISTAANCNLQSDRFDRQDRDYRPLQLNASSHFCFVQRWSFATTIGEDITDMMDDFGKRDGHRPLQFGKKSFRPLQFGKRGMEEAPDYFY
uniref:FMRFamide-related neuropeptides-like n=1 Tax=Elaeophora elaphi TaxID=1147741 RepID=A0A158Q7X0_9BILA